MRRPWWPVVPHDMTLPLLRNQPLGSSFQPTRGPPCWFVLLFSPWLEGKPKGSHALFIFCSYAWSRFLVFFWDMSGYVVLLLFFFNTYPKKTGTCFECPAPRIPIPVARLVQETEHALKALSDSFYRRDARVRAMFETLASSQVRRDRFKVDTSHLAVAQKTGTKMEPW